MWCVLITKLAKLFCFHAVRMILFFFHGVVIALFAFRTRQGDFCTHFKILASLYTLATLKKHRRPMSEHYLRTILRICQIFFDFK